jgi:hypothetical protein
MRGAPGPSPLGTGDGEPTFPSRPIHRWSILTAHERRAHSVSANRRISLPHLQLLSPPGVLVCGHGHGTLRRCAGARPHALSVRGCRLRHHAGACAPADERASARTFIQGGPGSEVVGFDAQPGKALLAAALLRLQRAYVRKTCREAALYASQSRSARAGGHAGGLEVVELPPLSIRFARNGGDRIGVDSACERLAAARVDARAPARVLVIPGPQRRGTGGTLLNLRSK